MDNLYESMLNTAQSAGIEVIGVEQATQILAVVYLYGDESAVYSPRMRADIAHICQRYGIGGAGTPDTAIITKVKDYVYEIRTGKEKPLWLVKIEQNYGVSFQQYKEYQRPKWGGCHGVRIS